MLEFVSPRTRRCCLFIFLVQANVSCEFMSPQKKKDTFLRRLKRPTDQPTDRPTNRPTGIQRTQVDDGYSYPPARVSSGSYVMLSLSSGRTSNIKIINLTTFPHLSCVLCQTKTSLVEHHFWWHGKYCMRQQEYRIAHHDKTRPRGRNSNLVFSTTDRIKNKKNAEQAMRLRRNLARDLCQSQ